MVFGRKGDGVPGWVLLSEMGIEVNCGGVIEMGLTWMRYGLNR